jgi:hypothetical protein
MKKLIGFICLIFCLSTGVNAQHSFVDDWKQIANKISTNNYYVQFNYALFENKLSTKAITNEQFVMQRNDEDLYYLMDSVELILNEDIVFVCDHRSTIFMIQKRTDEITKQYLGDKNKFINEFETLAATYEFVYEEVSSSVGKYVYQGEISHYDQIEMLFDKNAMELIKMRFHFANASLFESLPLSTKPVLEISYKDISDNQTIKYLVSNFGTFNKNMGFVPVSDYQSYNVLNHLEK